MNHSSRYWAVPTQILQRQSHVSSPTILVHMLPTAGAADIARSHHDANLASKCTCVLVVKPARCRFVILKFQSHSQNGTGQINAKLIH